MRKLLLLALGIPGFMNLHAQEPANALRYSWYVPGATARVKAVGGAMGSLGGDITASFVNPAGLAFYKTGDLVFSPNYQFGQTKSTYFNRTETEKSKKFTWGTTGFVIGGGGSPGSNVRNSALSIAYNRTADFNSEVVYRGQNNQSSYSQKFLEEIARNNDRDANVVSGNLDVNDPRYRPNYAFGTSLAFNTYWIDTVGGSTNGNFQFQSRSANLLSSGLLQQNTVRTNGGIDEVALGLAVNLRDKLMIGGSIGIPFLHYKRTGEFIEADATGNNNNKFDYAMVNEEVKTTGVGFNIKAGIIYKPQDFWRLGLSIHSPTFYTLNDKFQTDITTNAENGSTQTDYSIDYNNGEPAEFKYSLITPYKVIGSVSYVIREIQDVRKQRGFLTADVEYINYKSSSFTPHEEETTDEGTKGYLKQLNRAVDQAYKGAFNFRAGGELKFTTIMVRLGAAYYGNPYKDIAGEKGSRLNLSGGLGYRNQGFFIDLTYVHAMNKDKHFAYRLQQAQYSGATIKNTAGNLFLTLGFKI